MNPQTELSDYSLMKDTSPSKPNRTSSYLPENDQVFDLETMNRIKNFSQGHGLGKFAEFTDIIDSLKTPENPENLRTFYETFYDQVEKLSFYEKNKAVISQHDQIKGLCFSPNHKWIASATQESIRVWGTESNKLLAKFQKPDFDPMSIVMSDDLVFVGGLSGSIIKFKLKTKPFFELTELKQSFNKQHIGPVQVLLMTQDCKTLVSGGDDGLIVIWSVFDYENPKSITAHKYAILSLALDSKEINWSLEERISSSGSGISKIASSHLPFRVEENRFWP